MDVRPGSPDPADLTELVPGLHRLRLPVEGADLNVYLWLGDDGVTLVDTGVPGSLPVIEAALHRLGRTPRDVARIVLTHFHPDHTGSAAELVRVSDAVVVAGREDADAVRKVAPGPVPNLTPAERQLRGATELDVNSAPGCRVDVEAGDGDDLGFGDGAVALAVGGHTPGSLAVHLPAHRAVLTGDLVAQGDGTVVRGLFHLDRAQVHRSVLRLADTGAEVAGFGHGDPVLSGAADRLRAAPDPFA